MTIAEANYENIEIVHWSTSSQVQIKITQDEEVEESVWEPVTHILWMDYITYENLRHIVSETEIP